MLLDLRSASRPSPGNVCSILVSSKPACGGATFLGLGRALVGCSDFDELMELASKGDESSVDKSVGDIYGESGCVDLGMPAKLTAASFGRLATERLEASSCKADLVRALLRMVVQASVVVDPARLTGAGP